MLNLLQVHVQQLNCKNDDNIISTVADDEENRKELAKNVLQRTVEEAFSRRGITCTASFNREREREKKRERERDEEREMKRERERGTEKDGKRGNRKERKF